MAHRLPSVLFAALLIAAPPGPVAGVQERAAQAFAAGDYGTAAQIWLQRAEQGDPLAQYNLAVLYRDGLGVPPNPERAAHWLRRAAAGGLVDAYALLQTGEVAILEPDAAAGALEDPELWLRGQNGEHYTLQLASSKNPDLIRGYIEKHQLAGLAGMYKSTRKGEAWYALVFGAFPTPAAAEQAIADLPAELRRWSPWVRRIADVQRVMER